MCKDPTNLQGTISDDGIVQCSSGYVQTASGTTGGAVTAQCNDRAPGSQDVWTNVGSCDAVCTLPTVANSRSVNGSGHSFGGQHTMYSVTCSSGFYLSNSAYARTCTSAGGNFNSVPTCQACSHSNLDNVQSIVSSSGVVTCDYNAFKLASSPPASCNGVGSGSWEWTGSCVLCTTPSSSNARILSNGTVQCNAGFVQTASGPVQAQCADRDNPTPAAWTNYGTCQAVCTLPTVANSRSVEGGGHSFGGQHTMYSVTCSSGFYLSNSAYARTCTSAGGDFNSVPTCQSCSHSNLGNVQEINAITGVVTCSTAAFKLDSSPVARCAGDGDGKWQWSVGSCTLCKDPTNLQGTISDVGIVQCSSGYVQTASGTTGGAVTAQCNDRAPGSQDVWTNVGSCDAVCTLPTVANSRSVNGSGHSFGGQHTMYSVTCSSGFYLSNSAYARTCTSAGGNFNSVPTCQACSHSNLDNVQSIVSSSGVVTCDYNAFKLASSPPASCNGVGSGSWEWTGSCVLCTTPSSSNARILSNGTVQCNAGFVQTASGPVQAQCADRDNPTPAAWTNYGTCQAVCTLPTVANSRSVEGGGHSFGGQHTMYSVTCSSGFYLSNSAYARTCTSAGGDFNSVPTCQTCSHSNLDNVQSIVSSSGVVTCDYNAFKLASSPPASCNGVGSGSWEWTGSCVLCTTPSSSNARILSNGTVQCNAGFVQTASGPVQAQCADRDNPTPAAWTNYGTCQAVCTLPTVANSRSVEGGGHSFGGQHTMYSVTCSSGFYLSNSAYARTCTSAGGDFNSVPTCQSCSHSNLGNVQEINAITGVVTCSTAAFKLDSSPVARCAGDGDGKWQWSVGSCTLCKDPTNLQGMISDVGIVQCSSGYVQTASGTTGGAVTAQCNDRAPGSQDVWTNVGSCDAVCTLPTVANSRSVNGSGHSFGGQHTMYSVTCSSGFYLSNSAYARTCTSAGGNFNSVPTCQACSHSNLDNVQSIVSSSGVVTCDYNAFKLASSPPASCNGVGSGSWEWTGSCVLCTTPSSSNARILSNGTVQCNAGFVQTASGPVQAQCADRDNPTPAAWTNYGTCQAVCTLPTVANSRSVEGGGHSFGGQHTMYSVTCSSGFYLSNSAYARTCTSAGGDFNSVPTCQSCSHSNLGNVQEINAITGVVTCSTAAFKLDSSPVARCAGDGDGKWQWSVGSCTLCKDPTNLQGTISDVGIVQCSSGYVQTASGTTGGAVTAQCNDRAPGSQDVWTNVGSCDAVCTLPTVANSRSVNGSGHSFGGQHTMYSVTCSSGFYLSNSAYARTCTSAGGNFNSVPTCQACSHSNLDNVQSIVSSSGVVTCDYNAFKLASSPPASCNGVGSGSWEWTGSCVLCTTPSSSNARILSNGTVQCNAGFVQTASGPVQAQCADRDNPTPAAWTNYGTCQAVCTLPTVANSRSVEGGGHSFGGQHTMYSVTCSSGFYLSNSAYARTCTSAGGDFNSVPTCQSCSHSNLGNVQEINAITGVVTCSTAAFKLDSSPVARCAGDGDGKWQWSVGSCTLCKDPTNLQGMISDVGIVQCSSGYVQTASGTTGGAVTAQCNDRAPGSQDVWTNVGSCDAVCTLPTVANSRSVNGSGHSFGGQHTMYSVTCSSGFYLSNSAYARTCTSAGGNFNSVPTCQACSHSNLDNVQSIVSSSGVVTCDYNAFKLASSPPASCNGVGSGSWEWTGSCVLCTTPSSSNARILSNGTVQCNAGFVQTASGPVQAQCADRDNPTPAAWTNYGTCQAVCTLPTVANSRSVEGGGHSFGGQHTMYSVTCSSGFYLSNSAYARTCTSAGGDFNSVPTCQSCSHSNLGNVQEINAITGVVTCSTAAFKLDSSPVARCAGDGDGKWQWSVGSCTLCKDPTNLQGMISDVGIVQCSSGYVQTASGTTGGAVTAQCNDRAPGSQDVWTNVGSCDAVCTLPTVANSRSVEGSGHSFGGQHTMYRVTCSSGFYLSNSAYARTCTSAGGNFNSVPTCQACSHSNLDNVQSIVSSSGVVTCDYNAFKLASSPPASCNGVGSGNWEWTGSCVLCRAPSSSNATILSNGTVQCNAGFVQTASGPVQAQCTDRDNPTPAAWTNYGTCQAHCNQPTIANGLVTTTDIAMQHISYTITCNQGYLLTNTTYLQECQQHPTFSNIPTCSPLPDTRITATINGAVITERPVFLGATEVLTLQCLVQGPSARQQFRWKEGSQDLNAVATYNYPSFQASGLIGPDRTLTCSGTNDEIDSSLAGRSKDASILVSQRIDTPAVSGDTFYRMVSTALVPLVACVNSSYHPHPNSSQWTGPAVLSQQYNPTTPGPDGCLRSSASLDPVRARHASGSYVLTLAYPTHSGVKTVTHTIEVEITSVPQVSFSDVTEREGTPAQLNCTANGNPAPTVSILRDALLLTSTNGSNITAAGLQRTVATYNFDQVNRRDSGVYTCHAWNQFPDVAAYNNASLDVVLTAQYPPEQCVAPVNRTLVLVGEQPRFINVSCQCAAVPLPTYARSELLEFATDGPVSSVTGVADVYTIPVQFSSIGRYTCEAGNVVSAPNHFSSSFYVDVVASPRVALSSNNVTANSTLEVVCTVHSRPTLDSLVWRYGNGSVITEGGRIRLDRDNASDAIPGFGGYEQNYTLSISNVTVADRLDTYLCEASNGVPYSQEGTDYVGDSQYTSTAILTINVQTSAFVTRDLPAARTFPARGQAELECHARGNPLPHVTWFSTAESFSSAALVNTTFDRAMHTTRSVLLLPNVSFSDVGQYHCIFSNPFNTVNTTTLSASVLAPPRNVYRTATTKVNETDTFTLSCTFEGTPAASISWYLAGFADKPLVADGDSSVELLPTGFYRVSSNFTLINITRQDRSGYFCEAYNGVTPDEVELNRNIEFDVNSTYTTRAAIFLDVLFVPTLSADLSPVYALDNTQTFTLTCSATGNPVPSIIFGTSIFENGVTISNGTLTFDGEVVGQFASVASDVRVAGSMQLLNANDTIHGGLYSCAFSNFLGDRISSTANVTVSDINECLSSPCANGGTCTPLVASFECSCPPAWAGATCSIPTPDYDECMSNPCLNNATCIDQVGAFQCRCRAGFTGDKCQSLLDCPAFQRRDSGGIFCEPCACDQLGSESCDMTNGTCYCKPSITGSVCDRCIDNYYQATGKVSGCVACSCDSARTVVGNTSCDGRTGICNCLPNFSGFQCQYCSLGFFDLSAGCPACSCSAEGSLHAVCDQANNGQCACKPGSSGLDCAQCLPGFFKQNSTSQSCATSTDGQPCQDCRCSPVGSNSSECSVTSGECLCLPGYTGQRCDECTDAAQYYTEQAGCLNMNESMLTPLADTQVSGDSFSLTYPVVFGSSYAEYSNVTVSRNGFVSLAGFTGGYNRIDRVTDSIALVAPLWTNTATASRCNSGTVTSHVVSNSTDAATFSQILQAVRASSIGSEEFTPSEAVVTTWREMRENDTHDRRNTFQAAIIGDECQTFALFFYPKYGVSWLGNPKAVVAAWRPTNGNVESYFSPASVARQLVTRLTPGCSQRLRGIKKCRALVETPSYLQSTANLLQCPAERATTSVLGIFERQPAVSGSYLCYRSTPVSNGSRYQASSVCCYGSDGLLVDSGALQAYETYQVIDASILAYCQQGGVLNEFFGKRRSPRATTTRVALTQASGFGDPHLTNFEGEDFDFHGIGEYLMARFATPAAYNFSIFTRLEVAPVNALNFTSITRVAINLWISRLQQTLSVEVFAYSNNTLAIVGDDQLVQSIRAGNHTYFRLHSGSLVTSYGSSSVQVSVQQAPVLFLAFQVAHDPFSTVDGLLNMSRPSVDLSNSASVLAAAATLQVQPDHDVFTYDDNTTYATYNPAGVVPNQAVVDVLNISSEANATCDGDLACLADFIATGSTTLAASTLVTEKALQQSSIAVARSPPLITLSTDVLNANFNVTSNLTVRAAAALTLNISVIEVATSSGIVPGDLVSAYSPQSGLVLSWTPSQRQPSSSIMLRVRAVDSANQASIVTVPITLCSCFGECSAAPASTAVSTAFTLLACTACLPGQTGRICESDIDACLSQPCGGLRQCSDEPAPSLGYRCGACASGFRDGGSSNLSCVPMDECAEGVAVCAPTISTCQDQLASYYCPCAVGYTGTGNNSCVDVDECQDAQLNDCDHKYATCNNTRGSYTCGCMRGFQGPGISAHGGCHDINQCSTGQHDCVPEAECLDDNTIAGKHTCTCPDKQLQSSDRNCDVALTSRVSPDTPATQKFPVGTAITMTCLFTGFARNGISWTLASRSVLKHSSGIFTVVTSVTNISATSTLSFTIGANNLTGEYSCVGGNSRGSSTQTFLLTVTPAPTDAEDTKTNLYIIIGASVGGVVLLVVLGLVIFLNGRNRRSVTIGGHDNKLRAMGSGGIQYRSAALRDNDEGEEPTKENSIESNTAVNITTVDATLATNAV
ncbi:uncharacterized protein LOC135819142 isoform X2 [Sycon ciliatum]|uniref:uncharacterized protein LOC135819142 isoform X2 n=1 Tax=Sycon ciliatum TaxID=27933 RepID=UPI0031F64792